MQGWRTNMEDEHLCIENLGENVSLFGVFDGHGGIFLLFNQDTLGKQISLFTRMKLPDIIKNSEGFKNKDYKKALIDSFLGIDKLLQSEDGIKELDKVSCSIPTEGVQMHTDPVQIAKRVGCTACVALITPTEIYCANAGDSRCVLCKTGIAEELSKDHKPDLETEKSRIEKAGGCVEENRVNGEINLSRSLGDLCFKENKDLPAESQIITAFPDVKVEKITNESDFLIIGCDGIWDCLSSQEAVDFVKEQNSKQQFIGNKSFRLSQILEAMLEKIIAPDTASTSIFLLLKTL
jgi:serine/threonine protein phosphatase PrpC